MVEPVRSRTTPPNPIRRPAPRARPQAPGQGFTSSISDNVAMLRVPGRNVEDPAYKKRGVRRPAGCFPPSPVPSSGNQVVAYVHGSCVFADMVFKTASKAY